MQREFKISKRFPCLTVKQAHLADARSRRAGNGTEMKTVSTLYLRLSRDCTRYPDAISLASSALEITISRIRFRELHLVASEFTDDTFQQRSTCVRVGKLTQNALPRNSFPFPLTDSAKENPSTRREPGARHRATIHCSASLLPSRAEFRSKTSLARN